MSFEIVGEISEVQTIAAGPGIRNLQRLRRPYGRGRWRKLKGIALVRLRSGTIRKAELPGMRRMASAGKRSSASGMSTSMSRSRRRPRPRFVVCVDNSAYPASLELHKIYRVLADGAAAADGDLRVVDESGEDYLYPAAWFVAVQLPRRVRTSLLRRPHRLRSA
jgi:hypothetical protein